jgi:hypothetical protein
LTKARVNADNVTADIAGVTAGTGITGGGTSGTVTITNDMATTIAAKGDLLAGTANDAYSALTIGANDTVLTADSSTATGLKWATPAAGGMTLLSTTSLSGATTTISSISQAYNYLYILINGFSGTVNHNVTVRVNGSTTNANTVRFQNDSTSVSTGTNTVLQPIGTLDLENTNLSGSIILQINNYASTTTFKTSQSLATFFSSNSSSEIGVFQFGAIETTSAITSLTIAIGSGTFDAGTVLIYGVK